VVSGAADFFSISTTGSATFAATTTAAAGCAISISAAGCASYTMTIHQEINVPQ
jgi:hypothetical protein